VVKNAFGSSRAKFKLQYTGDQLDGTVPRDGDLALRFTNAAVTGAARCCSRAAASALGKKRGALSKAQPLRPSARARGCRGNGRDSCRSSSVSRPTGRPRRVRPTCSCSSVRRSPRRSPARSFVPKGDRFVFKGDVNGVTGRDARLRRETMSVQGANLDLGAFAPGQNRSGSSSAWAPRTAASPSAWRGRAARSSTDAGAVPELMLRPRPSRRESRRSRHRNAVRARWTPMAPEEPRDHRRKAREDLHEARARDHGRGRQGRARPGDERAPARGGHGRAQAVAPERHDPARDQQGRRSPRPRVDLELVTFEGFAPHKVPVIVECMTDNRNRTSPDMRASSATAARREGRVPLRARRNRRGDARRRGSRRRRRGDRGGRAERGAARARG